RPSAPGRSARLCPPSVLQSVRRAPRGEPDDYHPGCVDHPAPVPDPGVVAGELFEEESGRQHDDRGDHPAGVERDAGAGRADTGGEQLREEQREPAEIADADEPEQKCKELEVRVQRVEFREDVAARKQCPEADEEVAYAAAEETGHDATEQAAEDRP